jgi:hypothetical protein
MTDIRLNFANHDIDVSDFVAPRLWRQDEELQAIKQRLLIRLKAFRGEWFADINFGVPWLQEVLGSNYSDAGKTLQIIFRNEILKCDGVKSVSNIVINKTGRSHSVSFTANTELGNFSIENLSVL